jgi:hypothetical protein
MTYMTYTPFAERFDAITVDEAQTGIRYERRETPPKPDECNCPDLCLLDHDN